MQKITNVFSKVSTKMQRPCKGAIELLKGWHHDFKTIFSCKKEQKQRKVELHQRIQYLIFPKLKPLENCNWFWNWLIYNYWTEILPRSFLFQRIRQQQIPQFCLNSFVHPHFKTIVKQHKAWQFRTSPRDVKYPSKNCCFCSNTFLIFLA